MSVLKWLILSLYKQSDGYFEDPDAIDISSILSNADFMELKEKEHCSDVQKVLYGIH